MNYPRVTAIASIITASVAAAAALSLGRVVFVPIALAVVFAAVLRPVIRQMERWRLPAPAAATVLMLGMLAAVVAAGSALSEPAQEWAAKAPNAAAVAGKKLRALRHKFDRIGNALLPASRPQVQPAAPASPTFGNPDTPVTTTPAVVQVNQVAATPDYGPFLSRAFGTTTEIISAAITMLLVLFFLLAGGRTWRDRLVSVAPSPAAGKRMVDIVHEIQQVISRYFFVTLLINLGQGLLVGIAMWAIEMPSPVVWGILTAVLEFIPYAGGFVMVLLLALVGLSVSDSVAHAFIAPGIYLLITTLQNNLVSPLVYGRGMRLHPVPIIVAVVAGWFLWGVPGAFLAVPLLGGLSIICKRVEGFSGLGEFLAD